MDAVDTHETTSPRIAMLGLGAIGLPMGQRLADLLPVTAFDVVADRIALAEKAAPATSAAAACADADIAVISVNNAAQLDAVLFGDQGVAAGLPAGATVLCTSTVGVLPVQQAATRLAEQGIRFVDAAVSGGAARAREGDLLVFVGGDPDAVADCRPALEAIASAVNVMGDRVGDGQTMKAVNQVLCGIHIQAAGEALALADALGLDPERVLGILGEGAAASWMLANRGPRMVQRLAGEEPPMLSRLDVISKDMGIVHDVARAAGVAVPVTAAAEQAYLAGMAAGFAAEDDSIVVGTTRP